MIKRLVYYWPVQSNAVDMKACLDYRWIWIHDANAKQTPHSNHTYRKDCGESQCRECRKRLEGEHFSRAGTEDVAADSRWRSRCEGSAILKRLPSEFPTGEDMYGFREIISTSTVSWPVFMALENNQLHVWGGLCGELLVWLKVALLQGWVRKNYQAPWQTRPQYWRPINLRCAQFL